MIKTILTKFSYIFKCINLFYEYTKIYRVYLWRDIMDEEMAWENFLKTGSVSDYLVYSKFKNSNGLNFQEDNINASEHRRTSYKRNEYF